MREAFEKDPFCPVGIHTLPLQYLVTNHSESADNLAVNQKSESSMLTAGNTEIEVRIMWGLFRNGKHWKRGIFWITVISI